MATPMDVDSPRALVVGANGTNGLTRPSGLPSTSKVSDVIALFRPNRCFTREYKDKPTTILSLDFNDSGELMLSSESDETLQIYNVKDGKHSKACLSKKYGVKHAKFAHAESCIIYASTKENHDIRYLSTHDNNFIRYFKGHEKSVTCLALNPGADTFLSCSEDNTVRIWDTNTANPCAKLLLSQPLLAAFDPSAHVIAIASESAQTILLYDFRNYDKEPFATFDMLQHAHEITPNSISKGWNRLEFSNDGKSLLVGTSGHGHYLLNSFDGGLKSYLHRSKGASRNDEKAADTIGDACFSPDGRYVLSGQKNSDVLVWDTLMQPADKRLQPIHELEQKSETAIIAFNPRYNMFATADKEVVLWLPDRDAV